LSLLKYLCGTRVHLTTEEEAEIGEDFSIVVQERTKKTSLFLGTARFLNNECKKANAKLMPSERAGMEVRALQDIEIGDEITVHMASSTLTIMSAAA
jgi:histone-lysine N-methyltransferase SUV420H